jgi:tRNA pseudouridine38-40 synthase
MRYFIRLQFHGASFHGWQIQPHSPSVQGTLSEALTHLLGEEIEAVGAGRTDAGVHATQMVAHFDTSNPLKSKEQLVFRLNRYLRGQIVVTDLIEVNAEDHARFSAVERGYTYRIEQVLNPFTKGLVWTYTKPLNVEAMNEAAAYLLQVKDFGSFARSGSDVTNHLCDVKHAEWTPLGNELVFEIRANRFLRNMVRAIVGTLVDAGAGKLDMTAFREIVHSKNRSEAGTSAPAAGLYLSSVVYPALIENKWKTGINGE